MKTTSTQFKGEGGGSRLLTKIKNKKIYLYRRKLLNFATPEKNLTFAPQTECVALLPYPILKIKLI
jgi:hypothetical protein